MNLHPAVDQNQNPRQSQSQTVEFIKQVLQTQSIDHETADGILPSYVKLHQGHGNVSIVWGHMMGRNFRDELKERVWRGEGLIWVVDNPLQMPDVEEFIGARVKPLPGKKAKENRLHFFSHPLTGGSEFDVELASVCGLYLIPQAADVEVAAETKQGKHPVMIYRKYGRGHLLVAVFPLQFKTGAASVIGLLLNAVNGFSQDIYSAPDLTLTLTRILPLTLVLTNGSAQAKTLTIKELLPYGVEGYGYQPEPEAGEEIKWKITVPASGTETISYWLRLPDRVKSYEVKSELYDESGTRLKDVSLSFEVLQTVVGRIDELVFELGNVDASGKDLQRIHEAKQHLEKTRSYLSGSGMLPDFTALLHSVKAADELGRVEKTDVSALRRNAQEIMVIMGRWFYEKVKKWSPERLTPFLPLINGE
jgi:hypothetical protein